MKISHLLLLFTLQLAKIAEAVPPDEVPLWKLSEDGNNFEIDVNLKRTHSFLANKHLPVWIVNEKKPDNLILLENIMNEIGSIHMYQDLNNCAAAVYFSKRKHFDGTVDRRYAIKNYNPRIDSGLTMGLNVFTSQAPLHLNKHDDKDSGIPPDDVEPEHGINWRYIESRIEDPDVAYVETLVVVNYDICDAFAYDYQALVSEMLVTFNSVDTVYAKVDKPKIKINIAGIIIGNARNSLPLVGKYCYKQHERIEKETLNVDCVNEALKLTLDSYRKIIPRDSYDVVVFLTKFRLYILQENAEGKKMPEFVSGLAEYPLHDKYIGYTVSLDDIRICTVRHLHNFQHFAVIAHEMAHLFDVSHDPGLYQSLNKKCIGNLMRSDGFFCEQCIFFADTSIQQMKRFFRSRDGCKFRNEPRSLKQPLKPQIFWNEHKQCQCYGFLVAKKPQKVDCEHQQRLECLNSLGHLYRTGFFMDGTPCHNHYNDNKVCWNGKCQSIMN